MKQQEYATGIQWVPGGTSDGREGGARRGTTDACLAVRATRPDDVPGQLRPTASGGASGSHGGFVAAHAPTLPPVGPAQAGAAAPAPPSAGSETSPDPGLLRLAGWFAAAAPQTAHDLFTAAFGLYGARHFSVVATPEADHHGAPCAPAEVSWWHGPTAHASLSVRTGEPRPPRGLRRARTAAVPAVPGAGPATVAGRPGKHRRPEPARVAAAPQDRSATAERRIAARLLLAHPLVTAAGPHGDGFPLIRRHRDWLTERFAALLGYRLVVGPWHARLRKAGLGPGGGRRLERPDTGAPFTPAGYAQLALALAVLVDAPEQLPLGRLTAAVRAAAAPTVAPAASDADLAAALRVLADWQVLSGPAPDTTDPAAVLTVDRELARAVPAGPPALAADAEDLIRRAAEGTPEVVVRRLLAENPVVLAEDLSAEQRAWLPAHRLGAAHALAEFLGLEPELRAEGVALLDPAGELTDLPLTGTGTLTRAALLLAERLVEELRPLPGECPGAGVPIPDALIDGALGDIADEYGLTAGWGRDYLADRTALRRDALDLLHRMSLITPAPRGTFPPGWLLRAPAARYAPRAELLPAPGTGRHSRPDCPGDDPAPARASAPAAALVPAQARAPHADSRSQQELPA